MTEFYPEESTAPASPGVPHSREAEEAVVGAVLINPEVYYDIAQFLAADDFYIHRNKWIWEAFVRLHEGRTPVDLLTLSEDWSAPVNSRRSAAQPISHRLLIKSPPPSMQKHMGASWRKIPCAAG
jgi:replicative DNA helicase